MGDQKMTRSSSKLLRRRSPSDSYSGPGPGVLRRLQVNAEKGGRCVARQLTGALLQEWVRSDSGTRWSTGTTIR
jgi:hypothetical protein